MPDSDAALALTGKREEILHHLKAHTGASFVLRGLQLVVEGKPSQLERAVGIVELIRPIWERGQLVSLVDINSAIAALDDGLRDDHSRMGNQIIAKNQRGSLLRPRSLRQKAYVDSMEKNDLTFAVGPAGTGKTFLATVFAVRMLNERKVERLVLTRPAVEAGERLGFLPGDLQQKVDPYLRPLYDCLHALLGQEKTNSLLDRGIIEVAPLAYMRGRTLEDAFVILDEAQNTTVSQMRMVLTRLGERSRMVVTGDVTQVDLPSGQHSGLVEAIDALKEIEGIAICYLTSSDVMRHHLVQRVIEAFAIRGYR